MRWSALLLVAVVACAGSEVPPGPQPPSAGEPPTQSTAKQPAPTLGPVESPLEAPGGSRGVVFVGEASLNVMESLPIQVTVSVRGDLPTPCHQVAWSVERLEDQVEVSIFSLSDPGVNCIQVLDPFEAEIELGTFEAGSWVVTVNGEAVGEFEA